MDATHDNRTVLLDRASGDTPHGPLTDTQHTPRFEHLEQRMIHAAQQPLAGSRDTALNPLVGAAASLLSEAVRLKLSTQGEAPRMLNQRLADGIRLFETRALRQGLEASQVTTARYVLCTMLDEAVVTTRWGNESEWAQISLLSKFHNETFGGETFFQLLDQASRNPARHLPMLELMYLCLSLGFEGKYRVLPRGTLELETIRDGLFRQVRQLRGDVPRELSPQWEGLPRTGNRLVRIVPGWLVALFTLACLGTMYAGFAWTLGVQRERVLQPFETVEPTTLALHSLPPEYP